MIKKVWLITGILMLAKISLNAQHLRDQWVDSVFQTLTPSDKIGQLIMIPVSPDADMDDIRKTESRLREYNLGGIVFTGGGPVQLANLTNHLQEIAAVPLIVGMNAEEGIGAACDSTLIFPSPLTLGAIQDDRMLYFMGKEIGRQLRLLGVHLNFGPSVANSSTLSSAQLMSLSLGERNENIVRKSLELIHGLKDEGVLPVVKYHPDKGIRVTGFQKGIPVLTSTTPAHDSTTLQHILRYYQGAILSVLGDEPVFPDKRKRLTSKKKVISSSIPTFYAAEFLKQQHNFEGLTFTYLPDLISVQSKKFRPGEAEAFAFQGGNDILLFPENVPATIRRIKKAIRKNESLTPRLDARVKKILRVKYDAGLNHFKPINTDNLVQKLNTDDGESLQQILFEKSVTVVRNENQVIPIRQLEERKFASVILGTDSLSVFTQYLDRYIPFVHFNVSTIEEAPELSEEFIGFDYIIIQVNAELSEEQAKILEALTTLSLRSNLILVSFGSPSNLSNIGKAAAVIQAYSEEEVVQKIVPQIIFGALPGEGKLPLTVTQEFQAGTGVTTPSLSRLAYATPGAAGMDGFTLLGIDALVQEAIDSQATPGCQVIVARHGKVIYDKSFGWQTYEKKIPVTTKTIYDLASVTKVAATLEATMFLHEKGLISPYKKVSYYLPELLKSNKKDITVIDMLTHQAGLWPYLPFWVDTMQDSLLKPEYYSPVQTEQFPWPVAPNLYAVRSMKDSLWHWVINAKLREKIQRTPYDYKYSDMGFYILQQLNERLLNQPQEDFLSQNLYEPLGATTLGYLPLQKFPPNRIAPTENDIQFRKSLLIGTVHDQGAAMFGGTAGHAGLFGSATDLSKLGQMLLQEGQYGGYQYFKPETVRLFTAKQFEMSRRGLGWDKPVRSHWNTPTSIFASPATFGHTGFTGTAIWVDPEFDLVYVFLSNRVHPDMNNNKLINLNIRTRIQDVIYQSIFNYAQYKNLNAWNTSK